MRNRGRPSPCTARGFPCDPSPIKREPGMLLPGFSVQIALLSALICAAWHALNCHSDGVLSRSMASSMARLMKAFTLSLWASAWALMMSKRPFCMVSPKRSYLFFTYFVTAFCCAFETAMFTSVRGEPIFRYSLCYYTSIVY